MPLNIKLKSLDCTTVWKYNFPQNTEDKCQICRRSIMAPSHEDINNKNLISRISIGKCGHAFHSECIKNYCKKNVSCPIDYTQWETSKELEGPTIIKGKVEPKNDIEKNQPVEKQAQSPFGWLGLKSDNKNFGM
jgi:hypothetical protein